MASVDVFVLADTFQYSRQSFQNRTRVRTPDGWQWLSIPLEGRQHARPIADVRVASGDGRWKSRHWRSLEYNYRSSPYFEFYEDTIAGVLAVDTGSLAGVTVASVLAVRDILEIETPVVLASELDPVPRSVAEAAGLFPDAAIATVPEAEASDSMASFVFDFTEAPYSQNFAGYEPGLSILDSLFNVGPIAGQNIRTGRFRESAPYTVAEKTKKGPPGQ